MKLLSPEQTGGGGGVPPELLAKPIEDTRLHNLRTELSKIGELVGEAVKKSTTQEKPVTILLTGESATYKSTFISIMRHLLDSAGIQSEKVKEGRKSTLESWRGVDRYTGPAPGTRIVLWEATQILPPNMEGVDCYIQLDGTVSARLVRTADKTGDYEYAQMLVGATHTPPTHPNRKPDIRVNTDLITIPLEQANYITEWIEEGWKKALEGSSIKFLKDEENPVLQRKLAAIRAVGLETLLNERQRMFLAKRFRTEAIKELPDGRKAIYTHRIDTIFGVGTTSKINLEEIPSPDPIEPYYALSATPTGINVHSAAISHRKSWLTTRQ